jgi:hypothetical protein
MPPEIAEITKIRTCQADDLRGSFAGSLESRIPPSRIQPSPVADGTVLGMRMRGGGAHHAMARGIFSFPSGPDSARKRGVMELQVAAGESQMPKRLASVEAWIGAGVDDDRASFAAVGFGPTASNCQKVLHDPNGTALRAIIVMAPESALLEILPNPQDVVIATIFTSTIPLNAVPFLHDPNGTVGALPNPHPARSETDRPQISPIPRQNHNFDALLEQLLLT